MQYRWYLANCRISIPEYPIAPRTTHRDVINGRNHEKNLPNTLERVGERSMPTPSWIATLTGRIGAESKTCGQGCGNDCDVSRGFSSSRSYIDGWRGPSASESYIGWWNVRRAAFSLARTWWCMT